MISYYSDLQNEQILQKLRSLNSMNLSDTGITQRAIQAYRDAAAPHAEIIRFTAGLTLEMDTFEELDAYVREFVANSELPQGGNTLIPYETNADGDGPVFTTLSLAASDIAQAWFDSNDGAAINLIDLNTGVLENKLTVSEFLTRCNEVVATSNYICSSILASYYTGTTFQVSTEGVPSSYVEATTNALNQKGVPFKDKVSAVMLTFDAPTQDTDDVTFSSYTDFTDVSISALLWSNFTAVTGAATQSLLKVYRNLFTLDFSSLSKQISSAFNAMVNGLKTVFTVPLFINGGDGDMIIGNFSTQCLMRSEYNNGDGSNGYYPVYNLFSSLDIAIATHLAETKAFIELPFCTMQWSMVKTTLGYAEPVLQISWKLFPFTYSSAPSTSSTYDFLNDLCSPSGVIDLTTNDGIYLALRNSVYYFSILTGLIQLSSTLPAMHSFSSYTIGFANNLANAGLPASATDATPTSIIQALCNQGFNNTPSLIYTPYTIQHATGISDQIDTSSIDDTDILYLLLLTWGQIHMTGGGLSDVAVVYDTDGIRPRYNIQLADNQLRIQSAINNVIGIGASIIGTVAAIGSVILFKRFKALKVKTAAQYRAAQMDLGNKVNSGTATSADIAKVRKLARKDAWLNGPSGYVVDASAVLGQESEKLDTIISLIRG